MTLIISIAVILAMIGLLFFIPKMKLSLPCITILILTFVVTGVLAFTRPALHKPLSMSVIEYLIKINTDGSVTTTKQTTTTELGKTK